LFQDREWSGSLLALALRRFPQLRDLLTDDHLVDDFQRVSLARPHSRSTQKRAQCADVPPLPADDFTHVTFGNF
jgi:hypothetical protein